MSRHVSKAKREARRRRKANPVWQLLEMRMRRPYGGLITMPSDPDYVYNVYSGGFGGGASYVGPLRTVQRHLRETDE